MDCYKEEIQDLETHHRRASAGHFETKAKLDETNTKISRMETSLEESKTKLAMMMETKLEELRNISFRVRFASRKCPMTSRLHSVISFVGDGMQDAR